MEKNSKYWPVENSWGEKDHENIGSTVDIGSTVSGEKILAT
jgi:hypothetical protein